MFPGTEDQLLALSEYILKVARTRVILRDFAGAVDIGQNNINLKGLNQLKCISLKSGHFPLLFNCQY